VAEGCLRLVSATCLDDAGFDVLLRRGVERQLLKILKVVAPPLIAASHRIVRVVLDNCDRTRVGRSSRRTQRSSS
jgi:hypothetical protein